MPRCLQRTVWNPFPFCDGLSRMVPGFSVGVHVDKGGQLGLPDYGHVLLEFRPGQIFKRPRPIR